MSKFDKQMEEALVRFANSNRHDFDVYLEDYQVVNMYIYRANVFKELLKACEFEDVGNIYDYPNVFPQPESINGYDLVASFDAFYRIALSEKLNSVLFYTIDLDAFSCSFLIDIQNLKKFTKKTKKILQQDSRDNLFQDVDFTCKKGEYIEVTDSTGSPTKAAEAVKKKVPNENLIFHEKSTIVEVMNDIFTFFKKETRKLYERLQIAYKRGVILYGDPGNGKSAMIREIIRTVPKITKVVINPNVINVTRVLSSVIKALNGKQAIIIIEDIDSLITDRNRSQFLNIMDGVDIKSGVYFIGTTNYPEKIDPALLNRSGRFDRTYKIDNPSEEVRWKFFESRNIGELLSEFKVYKDDSKPDTDEGIVELFVKYSEGLPMANLKELITSVQYRLVTNPDMSIEEALETSHHSLIESRNEHISNHNEYKKKIQQILHKVGAEHLLE